MYKGVNFFSDFLVVLDDGLVPLARLLSLFKDLDDPTGCIGLGKPNGLPHLATSSSTLDSLDNSSLKKSFQNGKKNSDLWLRFGQKHVLGTNHTGRFLVVCISYC